jgi:protein-L-isoaspartate(D-aspartate) O-methyltransferase
MERLEAHRVFFADLITTIAGVPKSRLTSAFATTPRERYFDPGPWEVFAGRGYIQTPSGDPAFLYQDIVVGLAAESKINNGQPVLHAVCLAALNLEEGETVVHIGAGAGYYSAVLAKLTGPTGKVFSYEIEPTLAAKATRNLVELPNVTVYQRSGAEGALPDCRIIYVNAGATGPLDIWLDALQVGGRLLVPITPDALEEAPCAGAMLMVTHVAEQRFDARFLMPVMFIPCMGARDVETAKSLAAAFKRGDSGKVRSLRRKTPPDETCWCSGTDWWLSTCASV